MLTDTITIPVVSCPHCGSITDPEEIDRQLHKRKRRWSMWRVLYQCADCKKFWWTHERVTITVVDSVGKEEYLKICSSMLRDFGISDPDCRGAWWGHEWRER